MGRDGSRGQGQGGQGRGRGRHQGTKSRHTSTEQLEVKLHPHGASGDRQTVTCNTVKDHITQHVQKTCKNGKDVTVSLQDLVKKDLTACVPKRGIATGADETKKMRQDGMDVMHQAEVERHLEKKETLEHNLNKAHAPICSNCCSKTMQNCIKEHPDFKSKMRDDLIELLTVIKILMDGPTRAKCPHTSLTEVMSRAPDIKQMEQDRLLDCAK